MHDILKEMRNILKETQNFTTVMQKHWNVNKYLTKKMKIQKPKRINCTTKKTKIQIRKRIYSTV